jgi:hypothetical protein
MIYCLYTLTDITATFQYKTRSDLERLQQQNFDTVIQTIGLTANINYEKSPKVVPADMFGAPNERCWYFEWTAEREDVFEHNGDKIARLKETFEFVPFIQGLTETVKFDKPYFSLGRNIVFDYKQ